MSAERDNLLLPPTPEPSPSVAIIRPERKIINMFREPPVKKVLYWCTHCNVPLLARSCACGRDGEELPLLQPYDLRPALRADAALIRDLVSDRFGDVTIPTILLLNKTGGMDRNDLVIANGARFGWLVFDPVDRQYRFDIAPESLSWVVPMVTKGIVDLSTAADPATLAGRRLGGKKVEVVTDEPEGTVIVKYRQRYGTGVLRDGTIRVKELSPYEAKTFENPDWQEAVHQNRLHLKNLERFAVRTIKQHMHDRPTVNVSFSGGKDSTATLALARRAGVTEAFFIDTGLEFPETVDFVKAQGIEVIDSGGDFWASVSKAGPPGKDNRWCCKSLKLHPLKRYLAKTGPCVTVQGNRWYESWNRAGLEETSQNPNNPLQLNISPIRNWRAIEVFFYLWWRKIAFNSLYEEGFERLGCYLCPAMLEAEGELIKKTHPDYEARWQNFLAAWAAQKGLPEEYATWGLWRWRELPPKMSEICRDHGIAVTEKGTLATGPVRPAPVLETVPQAVTEVPQEQPEPAGPQTAETPEQPDPFPGYRKDFPLPGGLVYLDSAATSISPAPVLDAMMQYEQTYRANVGRGVHRLTQVATQRYWHAHKKVARFIGAEEQGEVVFTQNATEAIAMVAYGLGFCPKERVVTTILEHHSNLLPWMRLSEKQQTDLAIVPIRGDLLLDMNALEEAITDTTRLVAVTQASNVIGTIVPVREIAKICHDHGALLLVDAAQSVPHMPVDVRDLNCDFLCFSGHKMLGPTGTGVLWMKEPILEPLLLGGGAVSEVTSTGYTLAEGYARYEAGTPAIAGGIGLGAAVDYLEKVGMEQVRTHETTLTTQLIEGLQRIEGVTVYAPQEPADRIGVVSFNVAGFDSHTVAAYLDENAEVLVRSGHHCCMPLMEHLGLPDGTVRASLHMYSNSTDVETLLAAVSEVAGGV